MAELSSTRPAEARIEPPIDRWLTPTADRPVWTGHQLTLFHPGIVAKYLAADAASIHAGVAYGNIVVDQDVYDPLTLTVPRRDPGTLGKLTTQTLTLGRTLPEVPVGMQPAVPCEEIERHLERWPSEAGIDVAGLRSALGQAFEGSDSAASLAAQMDIAVRRLLASFGRAEPSAFASQLLWDEPSVVDQLLHDAPRCARLYNEAIKQHPGAGMKPMSVEPDRVEVPLWALRWKRPRRRVYVDLADSTPIFITDTGEPLGHGSDGVSFAPRALLMTAMLRRPDRCGLFIHGSGGWTYDRITERWWAAWQGETLAPMALVTADVYLDFDDLPVNTPDDERRAVWRAHHLPHNLDRELNLDTTPAREKRELLARMDDDRDKRRRRSAFDLIHRINADLAAEHPEVLARSRETVDRTRLGVANVAITGKRDWSFLLYPTEKLETLKQRITYLLERKDEGSA